MKTGLTKTGVLCGLALIGAIALHLIQKRVASRAVIIMEPPVAAPVSADAAVPALPVAAPEVPVTQLPISGPLAQPKAEISGLAWFGDALIILPQYPERFGNNIFTLTKAEIRAVLEGERTEPLVPQPIPFQSPDFDAQIDGFEGFEAIAFLGNQAFLTIESETADGLRGYVVTGTLATDLGQLTIAPDKQAETLPQSESENKADEALVVAGSQVMSLYEVNGAGLNAAPQGNVLDLNLAPQPPVAFPALEYRVTDATALDAENRFWVMNYFYEGDRDLVPPNGPLSDPLVVAFGQGASHQQRETVERLVELAYSDEGITLTDTPPIQLTLGPKSRNWEGLVRLDDRGFLLMTDKFPDTQLGFVAVP